MIFNSSAFFVFLAVVLAAHSLRLDWELRKAILLGASAVFYASWGPFFLTLLAASAITDWMVARRISESDDRSKRLRWLLLSLTINLGLLAVFKYGNFIARNLEIAARFAGSPVALGRITTGLPVGISFYTFESLAYSIDAYRRTAEPWKRFRDFGLYLAFFPHLVAGPIIRPSFFAPQLATSQRVTRPGLASGGMLLVIGLFFKIVIADTLLAPIVDAIFAVSYTATGIDAWAAVLAFGGQIYGDFAGYSLCAIGVARMLGFVLPDNFRNPYGAVGFSDFWQRWHISLSSWLRDYLYVPLGGNRRGTLRTSINITITMVLGGLWHGASWTFACWGLVHAMLLLLERLVRRIGRWNSFATSGRVLGAATTFIAVTVAWVFFRASSWQTAEQLIRAMAFGSFQHGSLPSRWQYLTAIAVPLSLALSHTVAPESSVGDWLAGRPPLVRGLMLGTLIWLILLCSGTGRAFIYFQF